jgi:hypothetical protein
MEVHVYQVSVITEVFVSFNKTREALFGNLLFCILGYFSNFESINIFLNK